MSNRERGEVTLTLDGADYVLRPTFEAMSKIEAATGKSLVELAVEAQAHKMHLDDAAIIVAECVRAHGKAENIASLAGVKAAVFAELIYDAGILKVIPRIEVLLVAAISGGHKPDDDDQGDDQGETTAATD